MKIVPCHKVERRRKIIGGWSIVNGDWVDYDYHHDLDIDIIGDSEYQFAGDIHEYTKIHDGEFADENPMRNYAVINELLRKMLHPGDLVAISGSYNPGLYVKPYKKNRSVCPRIMEAYQYAVLAFMNGFTIHGIWERNGAVYVTLDPVPGKVDTFGFAKCWGTRTPSIDPLTPSVSLVDILSRNQIEDMLYGLREDYSFFQVNFDTNTEVGADHFRQLEEFRKIYESAFMRETEPYIMHHYDQCRLLEARRIKLSSFNDHIRMFDITCPTYIHPIQPLSSIPDNVRWAIISDTLRIFDTHKDIRTIGQYFVYNKSDVCIGGGAFLANNFSNVI